MEEGSVCLGTNSYTFFSITKASCSLEPSVRITLYSEALKKGAWAQTSCWKVKLSVVRQKINQKCIWDNGTLPGITPAGKKSTQRQKNTNGWRYLHPLDKAHLQNRNMLVPSLRFTYNYSRTFAKFSQKDQDVLSIPHHVPITSKLLWIPLTNSHSYP